MAREQDYGDEEGGTGERKRRMGHHGEFSDGVGFLDIVDGEHRFSNWLVIEESGLFSELEFRRWWFGSGVQQTVEIDWTDGLWLFIFLLKIQWVLHNNHHDKISILLDPYYGPRPIWLNYHIKKESY